jgi:uncharacterized protein (TIGR04255 family)
MTAERGDLPDFRDPPVVEVALSLQFSPLKALRTPQLGLLWASFRDRFPNTDERPPLDAVIEQLDSRQPPRVRLVLERGLPTLRYLFSTESGNEVIQVQQDRFIHNWRKVGTGDQYPRYETIRATFLEELRSFEAFLTKENLGELQPNQCEITYVNHINSGEVWQDHGQLDRVVTVWRQSYSDNFLKEPENVRFNTSYLIREPDGSHLGRLYVNLEPRFDDKRKPILLMKLTARGGLLGEGLEGICGFFDKGREWVVRGFASITTEAMHRVWGRCDA